MNNEEEIRKLSALLDERTMRLMERESELADQFEEIEAQKEELTAAVEQLMSKNKDLLERNQELDQILYRSSHDLKSPLTSMFGLLAIMQAEELPEHMRNYCTHFERQLHQMNSVINTLTLLGKSVLDEIKLTEVKLTLLVEEEIQHLQYLEKFRQIRFNKFFSGTDRVYTDNLLIRIIVRCLVSNGIIFRDNEPGIVDVHVEATVNELIIKVTDDGEGIDSSIAPRIWDMFYRGSEKSKGQGMGLYLVKKIVERLRGDVRYYRTSHLTVFEISVPLVPLPTV